MKWTVRSGTLAAVCLVAVSVCVAGAEETADRPWNARLKNIAVGPGTFTFGGSMRFRYELLDNYNIKRYGTHETDNVLLERLRLDLEYKLYDNLRAFIQLQDAHFWLSDLHDRDFSPACPYRNYLDLKKGFIEWTHIGDSPFGFRIGRQAIVYRDSRAWGPGDWGNVGRYTWDAATFYWDADLVSTDFIFAQRVISESTSFDEKHFDFDAYGAYSRFNKLPFDLDLLYIYKLDDHGATVGKSGIGDLRRHTVGAHLDGTSGDHIDWGGLFAYQFGDYGKDEIRALGYSARLGCTFDTLWKPRIGVEYSFASGDSDPTDSDHNTFDGLFGAVDKFYGRMNMIAWKNLNDYQATVSVNPRRGVKVWVDYHYFALDEAEDAWYWCSGKPAREDPAGGSGTTLGHEIDLLAKWKVNDYCELFCGYAHFFPGSFIRHTGTDHDANWVFFQATLFF